MIKDITTSMTLAKIQDSGEPTIVYEYQVPAQSKAYLKKFGQIISDFTAVGSVIWRILKNGIPVYPYENILEIIGTAQQPIEIENIEFQGGDTLAVLIENWYNNTPTLGLGVRIIFEVI